MRTCRRPSINIVCINTVFSLQVPKRPIHFRSTATGSDTTGHCAAKEIHTTDELLEDSWRNAAAESVFRSSTGGVEAGDERLDGCSGTGTVWGANGTLRVPSASPLAATGSRALARLGTLQPVRDARSPTSRSTPTLRRYLVLFRRHRVI